MTNQTLNNFLDDTLTILNTQKFTSEEIVKIAVDVMENICDDSEEIHWNKIDAIFNNLFNNGLDLNKNIDKSIFDDCIWIENTSISIMLMKKFLEHGANPNLINPEERGSLYSYIDSAIGYDMFWDEKFIYIWLLLIAYCGRNNKGETELNMVDGFTYEIFKEIEKYYFYIEEKPSGYHMMYFFDKETKEIVASYEKHWNISGL